MFSGEPVNFVGIFVQISSRHAADYCAKFHKILLKLPGLLMNMEQKAILGPVRKKCHIGKGRGVDKSVPYKIWSFLI